jgi:hypothetical protein
MPLIQTPLTNATNDPSLVGKHNYRPLDPVKEETGFKKGEPIKLIELPSGTRIYRFDEQNAPERDGIISGWWSLFDSRFVNQMSAKDIYETACLNEISFSLMTRYFSAVKLEWNDLINYVEVTLQKPVVAFYGQFEPMALSGEADGKGNRLIKTEYDKEVARQKQRNSPYTVKTPEHLSGLLDTDPMKASDMISAWVATKGSSTHWKINSATGQSFPEHVLKSDIGNGQSEQDRLAMLEGMALGLFEAYQLFIPNFNNTYAGTTRTVLKADINNGTALASHFGSTMSITSVREERKAVLRQIELEKLDKIAKLGNPARSLIQLADRLETERQRNAFSFLSRRKNRI